MSICCFHLILMLVFPIVVVSSNSIIELSTEMRRYSQQVNGQIVICSRPKEKSIYKVWSSSYITIKSEKSACKVKEDIAEEETKAFSKQVLIIVKSIHWILSFSDSTGNICENLIIVPIFNKHCVKIEINVFLEINYVYKLDIFYNLNTLY